MAKCRIGTVNDSNTNTNSKSTSRRCKTTHVTTFDVSRSTNRISQIFRICHESEFRIETELRLFTQTVSYDGTKSIDYGSYWVEKIIETQTVCFSSMENMIGCSCRSIDSMDNDGWESICIFRSWYFCELSIFVSY